MPPRDSCSVPATADGSSERPFFVARQPIFDRRRSIKAYELLFRGEPGTEPGTFIDGNAATAQLLSHATGAGPLRSLAGGRSLFINFTRDHLVGGSATLLNSKRYVIEVLEDVPADPEVIDACRTLLADGYRVALDDVTEPARIRAFDGAVSLVKVDLLGAEHEDVEALVDVARECRLEVLAEKVETVDDLEFTADLGFDYFQGYYLSRPESVKLAALPGLKPTHVKLLDVVNRPELDVDEVARTVESDPSLSFKLLRQANAPARALNRRITSIRDVVVLFGQQEIRRAATFTVMGAIVGGSEHLLQQSVTLARFCDGVARSLGYKDQEAFDFYLVGLFSSIDALLGEPIDRALRTLPVSAVTVAALARREGPAAHSLELALAYLEGDWRAVSQQAAVLGLDESAAARIYFDAIGSADSAMDADQAA